MVSDGVDGMEWHGIASDGIGWHGMAWDDMVLHRMASDGSGWHGMAQDGIASDGMVLHQMASDGIGSMGWHGMASYGMGGHRMAWGGMVLHRILHKLGSCHARSFKAPSLRSNDLRPFYSMLSPCVQVLDWAAMTLNAHFTQLILIPEAQSLLVNLHKVIAEQVSVEIIFQLYHP